jgi:SAM-dependent methyltransferase
MYSKSILVTLGGLFPKPVKRVISDSIDAFYGVVIGIHRKYRKAGAFSFRGETYEYFYRSYQRTWRNERAVEIPIIWKVLQENRDKRTLEVGNVLAHYFDVSHDIVDKYEEYDNVINEDVATYRPPEKYDLIVTISTLEHVGWDETGGATPEPLKILQALENLKSILNPGGKIIATWPVGLNPELDRLLDEGRIPFSECYCMERISRQNTWIEASWGDIRNLKYKFPPFPHPYGLVITYFQT